MTSVPDDDIGARAILACRRQRRHGMAIDQQCLAKSPVSAGDDPPQGAMIRLVDGVDARHRLLDRQPACIDLLRLADHARHGSKPAGDPHRTGVGEGRQAAVEHARIEFIGLAVHIHHRARKMRPEQRHAALDHALEQGIDIGILGAPQGRQVEPDLLQEAWRIDTAGMRRVEHHRSDQNIRFERLESRVEIADMGVAHRRSVSGLIGGCHPECRMLGTSLDRA
jgi:hypothetical protein